MKEKKRKFDIFNSIQSWFLIILGLFIYTFGWSAFLIPIKLAGGGVLGIVTILHYALNTPIGWMNLAINAILIIIALKILGFKFIIKTIICIFIVSVFFEILIPLFPEPLLKDNILTCTIIGSGLSALGIGLAIANGGNTGGTDIVVLMLGKYKNISYGKTSLIINVLIIASLYFVTKNIETLLYSYLNMIISTLLCDYVIGGFNQSYQIMVFSNKNNLIAARISTELTRGVTLLNGYGWYTKNDQEVLITMVHRTEKHAVMRIIKHEDPNAFISFSKVQGVYGKNFDELKVKTKKKD
ncbi:MAG: YitT family protein [Bacteroidales bacterium]|jgi:uncharacterized membrane-anchored protein YitT (DUF2179 family)|nr:YitT family protein [Bacteroidales bacterium]